jgi:hypothetical protein
MQNTLPSRTPPTRLKNRVSASLLTRATLLALLALLAPSSVNATRCVGWDNDANGYLYGGKNWDWSACTQGWWNQGCGLGCDKVYSGKSN